MGRPEPTPAGAKYRDKQYSDAVSLHTIAGESYNDAFADDYEDDVPDISAPPTYDDATATSSTSNGDDPFAADPFATDAHPINPVHGGTQEYESLVLPNGVTNPESHTAFHGRRIGAKRSRISNEVVSVQEKRSDSDPTFLQNWVQMMAGEAPSPYIHVTGSHTETKRDHDGKTKIEEVVDFRIMISLRNYLWPGFKPYGPNNMTLVTAENGEKTYRGTVFRKRAPGIKGDIEVGDAKPTLKEWCHRYCASATGTRVFRLARTVTGMDEQHFRSRLEGVVRSTNYRGNLSIEFPVADRAVDIYSGSHLNNWRMTTWVCWLFYLTFLWIFSWPILIFTTKRYHVVRAEWPFSQIDAQGGKQYTTVSEEQWINKWGPAVRQLCLDRYQGLAGDSLLTQVLERTENQAPPGDFENGRAAVNKVVGAAGALRAGGSNLFSQASNLFRFATGSNDQVGWGFDT